MSGKPSSEGVAEVLKLLRRVEELDAEISELKPKADRLRSAECEKSNAASAVAKLLASMDVAATGNHGFESRMAWFVAELARQASVKP